VRIESNKKNSLKVSQVRRISWLVQAATIMDLFVLSNQTKPGKKIFSDTRVRNERTSLLLFPVVAVLLIEQESGNKGKKESRNFDKE